MAKAWDCKLELANLKFALKGIVIGMSMDIPWANEEDKASWGQYPSLVAKRAIHGPQPFTDSRGPVKLHRLHLELVE